MTAEDILEQISGILDDNSVIPTEKVYLIKDIVNSEAKEVPLTTPRLRNDQAGVPLRGMMAPTRRDIGTG